jgi:hypothetical protein
MHIEASRRWRMGAVVETSDTVFLKWLGDYVSASAAMQFPVVRGLASFGNMLIEPLDPGLPLRATVSGIVQDEDGHGYPLARPLEAAVTPVGAGDRVTVELSTQVVDAHAYLVRLMDAILTEWPTAAQALWLNQPSRQERTLGEIRLKTDPTHFTLGLGEFARPYHAGGIVAVHFSERPDPASENHPKSVGDGQQAERRGKCAWGVHLHLPGSARPYRQISELELRLALSRMSGKYPVMATLTQCGKYVFPETDRFARDFLSWCRENWHAAPQAPTVTAAVVQQPPSRPDQPWQRLPEHLWDRQAVELWWAGHSHKEIGQQLSQAPKTVRNRLAQLRKAFGPQIVPLRHGRDNSGTSGW